MFNYEPNFHGFACTLVASVAVSDNPLNLYRNTYCINIFSYVEQCVDVWALSGSGVGGGGEFALIFYRPFIELQLEPVFVVFLN